MAMLHLILDNNKGNAIIITLFVASILAIIGATFTSVVIFNLRNAPWQLRRVQGFYITEAGLDKAIALLRDDDDWSDEGCGDGSATHNFDPEHEGDWYPLYDPATGDDVDNIILDNGAYSVQLRNPPGSDGKAIEIRAEGEIGESKRVIQVRTQLQEAAWAMFGGDDIKIVGDLYIDSYNSDDGLYEDQIPKENGNVGSNDDIRVTGNATILGNATPGPDGEIWIIGSATVTGSTEPASKLVDLPPLDIDFPFAPSGELKKTGPGTHTLTEGIYCFTQVKFTGSHELRTEGHVTIYCESVSFTGTSKITVNGKLTFYCTGDFKSTGNGIINTNKKPEDFTLYCTGEDVKLTGSSNFYGTVYAPDGDVNITGGYDYYGSIIAGEDVEGTGNARIHYDEALGIGAEMMVSSWHEVY